ncbi:glucoamylase family protein [Sphingobacterium hungaricum]
MKSTFTATFLLLTLTYFSSCNQKVKQDNTDNKDSLSLTSTPDDSLLNLIQKQTFRYFWEGAETTSGLARERIHIDGVYPLNDQHVITIGGSGFGLMGILVAMERQFITKEQGYERLTKTLDFLGKIERFHGAWAHWYDGTTGKAKPFSKNDNGGDLVETSFMAQALICIREYYKDGTDAEKSLASKADELWKGIDFDFYRNGKDVLSWHWSPTSEWEMNHPIKGYDECLITYVVAASSPTHAIPASTYHQGWARNGAIKTDAKKYGIPVLLKHNALENEVGPLFWEHYSYLGLNPNGLTDQYANYEDVTKNHVLINIEYAKLNPNKYVGYGPDKGWGLTASYSIDGYNAHHPDNDKSVISPTAALSSMPYTPKESMAFAKYAFSLGDKLWGEYGFYDAYSETENWFPQQYLAIDQGPIVVMIENYRSKLLWDLFMNAPDVQNGLKKLGFTTPYIK